MLNKIFVSIFLHVLICSALVICHRRLRNNPINNAIMMRATTNAIIYEISANLDVLTLHWLRQMNDQRSRLLKCTSNTVVVGRTSLMWILMVFDGCYYQAKSFHLIICWLHIVYWSVHIPFAVSFGLLLSTVNINHLSSRLTRLVRWIGKQKTGNFLFALLVWFAINCQFYCFAFFESKKYVQLREILLSMR